MKSSVFVMTSHYLDRGFQPLSQRAERRIAATFDTTPLPLGTGDARTPLDVCTPAFPGSARKYVARSLSTLENQLGLLLKLLKFIGKRPRIGARHIQ
jgi:hypothetical protein